MATKPDLKDIVWDESEIEWDDEKPSSFSLKNTISNIPESAINMGKGVVNSIIPEGLNKEDLANTGLAGTAKGLVKIAAGGVEKLIPEKLLPAGKTNEASFDAVVDYFKQRYGGLENIKQTIEKDPVGFAADLSAVLGGGGAALKAGGLSKTGNIVSKTAGALDPVNQAVNVGRGAVKLGLKTKPNVPELLYQKALKPGTTLKESRVESRIATALDEKIPVSKSGLNKSQSTVRTINEEIAERINQLEDLGQTVDTNVQIGKLEDLKKDIIGKNQAPKQHLAPVDDLIEQIKEGGSSQIPAKQAQEFKKSYNKELTAFYDKVSRGGTIDSDSYARARAAAAEGIRDELNTLFPELKNLNARDARLIELNKSLSKAVNRVSNNNLVPLLAGVVLTGGKGGFWKGMGIYLADSPYVKSRLAIALNASRKKKFATGVSLKKQAFYQAGKNQGE